MPSPFPGMDPYLEHPRSWPNLHHRLIAAIAIHLAPQLRPKYRVVVEEAIYQTGGQDSVLVGVPDVSLHKAKDSQQPVPEQVAEGANSTQPIIVNLPIPEVVRQGYLEIQEIATREVITAIEILSPTNKRPGEGRRTYEAKRQTILASATSLVEIDLLRQWPEIVPLPQSLRTHYRILVSASVRRPQASLYGFNLPEPIPAFPLPLQGNEPEPIVRLQPLLDDIYDQSGYDLAIDYRQDPIPPLLAEEASWLAGYLKEAGYR